MRVIELMEQLGRLDPTLDVLAYAQYGEHRYLFFDIESIELRSAARSRDEIGLPLVDLDDANGRPLAVMTLTSDF